MVHEHIESIAGHARHKGRDYVRAMAGDGIAEQGANKRILTVRHRLKEAHQRHTEPGGQLFCRDVFQAGESLDFDISQDLTIGTGEGELRLTVRQLGRRHLEARQRHVAPYAIAISSGEQP